MTDMQEFLFLPMMLIGSVFALFSVKTNSEGYLTFVIIYAFLATVAIMIYAAWLVTPWLIEVLS